MESATERKQKLIELFPEAHLNGELNLEKLCSSLGMNTPPPAGMALSLSAERLHSLRNCAAVIQSSARLLQRRTQAPEMAEIIESLVNASEKMRQLLQT